MTIRRARVGDIPRLSDLLSQVLDVHHNGRPDIFKPNAVKYLPEELEEIIADDTRPIFVAETDGEVVGYAFCIIIQHIDNNILTDIKTLYVDDLCIDENCRGKGVGKALYKYVESYARDEGFYNVTLNVWALNDNARGFYENLGLKVQKIGMEQIL